MKTYWYHHDSGSLGWIDGYEAKTEKQARARALDNHEGKDDLVLTLITDPKLIAAMEEEYARTDWNS